jgi:hypothetical protein
MPIEGLRRAGTFNRRVLASAYTMGVRFHRLLARTMALKLPFFSLLPNGRTTWNGDVRSHVRLLSARLFTL